MRKLASIVLTFVCSVWFVGLGVAYSATVPPIIVLEKSVHFISPHGDDVVVGHGTYAVEVAEGGLRLIPQEEKYAEAILIAAQAATHEQILLGPDAELLIDQEGDSAVTLRLPEGEGWEAIGSTTGVRTRGGNILKPFWCKTPLIVNIETGHLEFTKSTRILGKDSVARAKSHLLPGRCGWVERPFKPGEPNKIRIYHQPIDIDHGGIWLAVSNQASTMILATGAINPKNLVRCRAYNSGNEIKTGNHLRCKTYPNP